MAADDIKKDTEKAQQAKDNLSKILTDVAKDFNAASGEIGNIGNSLAEMVKDAQRAGLSFEDIGHTIVSKLEEELKKAGKAITIPNLLKQLEKYGVSKEISKVIEQLAREQDRFILGAKSLAQELSESLMKPFDKFMEKIEKIPGGKFFNKIFKFDDARKNIKNDITSQLVKASKEGELSFKTLGDVGKTAFKGIGKAADAALAHPMLLAIAAIIALLYVAYKQWNKTIDAAKALRDETGLTGKRAKELSEVGADIAAKFTALGVDMKVTGKATAALVNEFQDANVVSKGMIENAALLSGALGVSEQSAAKVVRQFKVMGGLSDEMSGNLLASVANASDLAGVAPAKVFEDMAQSTKEINTYFKGNVLLAAKTAIELRRMGTSLKEAANSAKSMVDFESSISSELEASVLLGRQLDFSAARYYAFTGDIQQQQKEILKQVGSIAEFNRLMPFQKEAIAKATGMEVDQLANMLQQQEDLNKLTAAQKLEYQAGLKALDEFQKANKLDLIAQNQRQLAQEKFAKTWENLVFALSSTLFPLFDALYALIDPIATAIQQVFASVKGNANIFGDLKQSLGEIGKAIAEAIPPLIEILKVILPPLIRYVKMFLDPFIIGIKIIAALLTGNFADAMNMIPELFSSIIKRVLNGLYLLPQLFLAVLSKMIGVDLVGVFQKAIDWLGNAMGTFISIVSLPVTALVAAFDNLGKFLKLWWDRIYNLVFAPFADAVSFIGDAIKGVGNFFSGIFGGGTATIPAGNVPATATGGVVTRPQVRLVGEQGPEAIIPLGEAGANSQAIVNKIDELINKSDPAILAKKLDEMIEAIKSMKIYLDHREVGSVLAENTTHPGFA